METLSHHQAKASEFLHRADLAINSHDPTEAAVALRRAASHITTALAVHQGWKHRSQRQLETVLHVNIAADNLSRSHLKTLRQAHTLPTHLSSRAQRGNPVGSCDPSHAQPEHKPSPPARPSTGSG